MYVFRCEVLVCCRGYGMFVIVIFLLNILGVIRQPTKHTFFKLIIISADPLIFILLFTFSTYAISYQLCDFDKCRKIYYDLLHVYICIHILLLFSSHTIPPYWKYLHLLNNNLIFLILLLNLKSYMKQLLNNIVVVQYIMHVPTLFCVLFCY